MDGRHEAGQPACATQRALDWASVDWSHVKRHVEHLQQRIFRDTRAGNLRMVSRNQKLLAKSLPARLWAVKLVTELNDGRNTPGVDGHLCKTSKEKASLAEHLRIFVSKPDPVKVVWIPKSNGEKRRLGIPSIRDRALQALVLLAMDPEWEAKFEPHSFGFRPGRSAIDATHHIVDTLIHRVGRRANPGWVLDADITKCFDSIDHETLLGKIGRSPFRRVIRAWLKSGAVSRVGFERTERGTPQGGVISPLLANIALDGLERQFGIYSRTGNYRAPSERSGLNKDVAVFRYADDFIVLGPSREALTGYVIPKVKDFLSSVGLELSVAKTRVVHVADGFEFLGFSFRRFYRRDGSIKELAFTPSRKRCDKFLAKLRDLVESNRNIDVKLLIQALNRRIRGFCNYFRWSNAYKMFGYMAHRVFKILWQWARKRHRKRGRKWLREKYWKVMGHRHWVFTFQGINLLAPYQCAVQWWKRPKVRLVASTYDPTLAKYWQARRWRHRNEQEL